MKLRLFHRSIAVGRKRRFAARFKFGMRNGTECCCSSVLNSFNSLQISLILQVTCNSIFLLPRDGASKQLLCPVHLLSPQHKRAAESVRNAREPYKVCSLIHQGKPCAISIAIDEPLRQLTSFHLIFKTNYYYYFYLK